MATLLRLHEICKSYNAPVLSRINLELHAGEVHALVGANGAGKSTLARIICGMTEADSGSMEFNGSAYAPTSKPIAEQAGVHIVHQELNLIPTLTVGENLFLSRLPRRLGFVSRAQLQRNSADALRAVGMSHVHPSTPTAQLGVGQQQLVEIASALTRNLRLLILDEPTAMLTQPEIDMLFARIRELKAASVGLIYISHRMEELKTIADHVSVLRDGQVVFTAPMADVSTNQLVTAMTGTTFTTIPEASSSHAPTTPRVPPEPPVALAVQNLCRGPLTRDVSFTLRRGEILGLSGLVGSGRTETLRAIFGADIPDSGTISIGNPLREIRIRSPRDAVRAGIGMLPEDRKALGLLLTQAISANVSLARVHVVTNRIGWLSRTREHHTATDYCRRVAVQCSGMNQRVAQLSGGNQQKVLIARWLLRDCDVLLFDEPTRGIDVSARRTIYALLRDLVASGKSIIVASSDQQELMELCDRIAVMSSGRLVQIFNRGEWDEQKLMDASFSEYINRRESSPSLKSEGQLTT